MNQNQFERPEVSRHEVNAVVKWYNPVKGFGFVQPSDGSPDAFLHISVVEASGHQELPEGTTIVCDIAEGPRGPQVAAIVRVENIPEGAAHAEHDSPPRSVDGTVKFFNVAKGFGFVAPDDGGKDVYVSIRALERSGINYLEPEQRVRLMTRMGQKGPMADRIELI